MRENYMPIAGIFIVLLIGFFTIDVIYSKYILFDAVLIDKQYKAETHTSGTGYGVTTGGQVGLLITSQHESEKFILILKKENGEIISVECTPELYYSKEKGNVIVCKKTIGYITNITWIVSGVN